MFLMILAVQVVISYPESSATFVHGLGYPLDAQRYIIEHSSVKIDTSLVYCHYSLNDTTLEQFIPFLKEKGIGLIGASVSGPG